MTSPPDASLYEVPPKPLRSRLTPIFISLLCAILLAAGSCYGFLKTFNYNSNSNPAGMIFALGFLAGAVAIPVLTLWATVVSILYFVRIAKKAP